MEDLYTLNEARREIARQECATHGHNLTVIATPTGPTGLICDRHCGHPGWHVTPASQPGGVEALEGALRLELAHLWLDLANAYDRSQSDPPETSPACRDLVERIRGITMLVGPADTSGMAARLQPRGLHQLVYDDMACSMPLGDLTGRDDDGD